MGRQRKFTPWLAGITALVALAILLFPVYAVIVGSFENNAQLLGTHYNFFPPTPTLANYRNVISTQGGHILSVVYHKLHLLNSYPGLILADASYAVPFSILVMRAFMLGLPTDVLQAARVDGATEWGTFVRIVLPMSRSAIITIALFAFLNGWGDFIFALTLLNGSTLQPITLSIYNYIGVFSSNLGAAMALAVFAILPAAMMLIAAQRYIAAGLTVGSVKG